VVGWPSLVSALSTATRINSLNASRHAGSRTETATDCAAGLKDGAVPGAGAGARNTCTTVAGGAAGGATGSLAALGVIFVFFFAAATWLESSSLEDSSLEDSSARGLLVELVFAAIAAFTESVRFTEVGVFRLDLSPAPPSNCSLVFLRLWSIFFCADEAAGSGGAVALPERVPLEGAK
jgi:hypothetical protein